MRKIPSLLLLLSAATFAPAFAADLDLRVILSGEIRPGVYGRVDLGNASPPPLLYVDPVVIRPAPRPVPAQPLYLHVPPGHAKHWSKHCSKYNACGTPVYFVTSSEYEPKKQKKAKKVKKDKHDRD